MQNQDPYRAYFWGIVRTLLPQKRFDFAEICTRGSILAKTVFEKPFKILDFYENETDPKFALLVQLWTLVTSWRWPKSKEINPFPEKTLTIKLFKYVKIKALSSLPFPGRNTIFNTICANFGRKQGEITLLRHRIKIGHSLF